jgi:hypothetical protein
MVDKVMVAAFRAAVEVFTKGHLRPEVALEGAKKVVEAAAKVTAEAAAKSVK